jgi:hypothetical protein
LTGGGFLRAKRRGRTARKIDAGQFDNGTVIDSINVSGLSDPQVERAERGLLRNMDKEAFFTKRV